MTTAFSVKGVISRLDKTTSTGVSELDANTLKVDVKALRGLLAFLKNTPGLAFDYLIDMTAVDYWDYFEVIYQLASLEHNHKITVKTAVAGRENPVVPSIVDIYKGADYQEREIHDLLGIKFDGHPNLIPLLLWEGFEGHPLRRDYL